MIVQNVPKSKLRVSVTRRQKGPEYGALVLNEGYSELLFARIWRPVGQLSVC